jgi:hypothetical protein
VLIHSQMGASTSAPFSQWGTDMRAMTAMERKATLALAEAVGSEKDRNQLLLDIRNCTVEDMVPDRSLLRFHVAGYKRPPQHGRDTFRGEDRFPVEGSVKDADGGEMDVLLLSDKNNRALELELVKHAGGPVLGADWNSFRLK